MASTRLTKTNSTPTNAKKFTFSFWMKRGIISSGQHSIIAGYIDGSNNDLLYIPAGDTLGFWGTSGGSQTFYLLTNRLFRDTTAWSHIVLSVDTTQSTASDRVKIYVNGVQETSFSQSSYPAQNLECKLAIASTVQEIGSQNSSNYFDGSMTHIHYTDGYTYAATDFGETDSTSGIWKPKTAPSVTHGNNGFFLKMENSGAMGTDSSGNTNTFTVNGTITQNVDTPSNNFATLNPLQSNLSLVNGNTTATTTNYKYGLSTMAVNTGKWYFEMKVTHACMIIGIQDMIKANDRLSVNNVFWFSGSQSYHLDGFSRLSHDSYGDIANDASAYPTYTNGDIVMMALDLTNNKLAYGKNGTWYNSTNPGSGTTNMVSIDAPSTLTSGFYGIVAGDTCGASDGTFNVNFGQGYFGTTQVASANSDGNGFGLFEYSVPSGYYALCTKNIKEFG